MPACPYIILYERAETNRPTGSQLPETEMDMLYTSYGFIAFLAALFTAYYVVPRRVQKPVLLLFSLFFYASYGVLQIVYITFTALTTYISARLISARKEANTAYIEAHKKELSRDEKKARREAVKKKTYLIMSLCLIANFGILAFLKYANFTIHNINSIVSLFGGRGEITFLSLTLPIGISFYTFMSMGYVIDVYRGKYQADKNFFHIALFIAYFPQLLLGPFSRYDDVKDTLFVPTKFSGRAFAFGIERIIWGFFKKLVVADRVLIPLKVLIASPDKYPGTYVFAAMILYAARIYADFTGGIDITMGISEALGIRLKENFIRPYFSKSVAEYWRRWHITLGDWFREYVFYPMSIWGPLTRLTKKTRPVFGAGFARRFPVYVSTVSVWFVTGIWHGASWNFIAWGMANCIVILISSELTPLYDKFHKKTHLINKRPYHAFMMLRTFFLMGMIRMFDCYVGVGTTIRALVSMFTEGNWGVFVDGSMLKLGLSAADYIIVAAAALLMFAVSVAEIKKSVRERLAAHPVAAFATFASLALVTAVFGVYGIGYDSSQFIYTQY